jgi:hypothetical protein
MPIFYAIEPALNLLYYAGFGDSAASELQQLELTAFQDPLRRPGMLILTDLSSVIEMQMEVVDLRILVERNRELNEAHYELEKTAVVTRSSFAATLASTITTLAYGLPLKLAVFHNLPDAVAWLGLADGLPRVYELKSQLFEAYQQAYSH